MIYRRYPPEGPPPWVAVGALAVALIVLAVTVANVYGSS